MTSKLTITDGRVISVIERLEHYASNLKWTDVRRAQDLLTAADGLRELQERRKADSEPVAEVYQAPNVGICAALGPSIRMLCPLEPGTKLYRHAQPAPEKYNIGDATKRHIFTPTGMTNVSDMQAVFDRVEAVLVGMDQPAPVVPDGYVMVPMRLTAENGAKGALSGEFSETKFVNCPECFGDDECETCDGSGRIEITVPVTWTTIKEIWAKGVEHFAAAPQSPGSEPATVPGKWIPVSERMPELDTRVLLYFSDYSGHIEDGCIGDEGDGPYHYFFDGDALSHEPTHWMPLPAVPQEVKGE
ncbi:TPA: DUF551 domain-containing protein [Klebsiella pneumoniae]